MCSRRWSVAEILFEGRLLEAIMRAGAFIRAHLERELEEIGLTTLHVELMRIIAMEAPSQASLARRLGVKRQSLDYAIGQLRRAELVESSPSDRDRRAEAFALTDDGVSRLAWALKVIGAAERRYLGGLCDGDRERVLAALDSGVEAILYEERMSWWPPAVAMRR